MSKLTLENKVMAILEKDKESRNDDIRLTKVLWYFYYKDLIRIIDGNPYINLHDLTKLPHEDTITRIRRRIQNTKHLYLPTNKEVAAKRGINEIEWREYLGYNTTDTL